MQAELFISNASSFTSFKGTNSTTHTPITSKEPFLAQECCESIGQVENYEETYTSVMAWFHSKGIVEGKPEQVHSGCF